MVNGVREGALDIVHKTTSVYNMTLRMVKYLNQYILYIANIYFSGGNH